MKIKLTILFGLLFITNAYSLSPNDTIVLDGFFTDEMWDSSPKTQKLVFFTSSKEVSDLPISSIEVIAYTDSLVLNGNNIMNSYRNEFVTIKAICLSKNTTSFDKKTIDWTFELISITSKKNQQFDWEKLPTYKTITCEALYLGCEDVNCYCYIKESNSKPFRFYSIHNYTLAERELNMNQTNSITFEKVPNIDESALPKYLYIPYFEEETEKQSSSIQQKKIEEFDSSNPSLLMKLNWEVNYHGVKYVKHEIITINSDKTRLEIKNISDRTSCDNCKGQNEKRKEVISIYQILNIKNPISGEYTFKLKILKSTVHISYYNGYDDYRNISTTGSLMESSHNEGDFWINFISNHPQGKRRSYSFLSNKFTNISNENIVVNGFR